MLGYLLSFVYVGIYWNNHHHMMHASEKVNGATLWANLHLLFWLSLIPFGNNWLWHNPGSALPTSAYGVILFMCGVAYTILARVLIQVNGAESTIAKALRRDVKGKLSVAFYLAAVGLAFLRPWIADAVYVVVAAMWLVPDRRIEREIES
jgi:uncharacterized membrane protein